MGKKSDRTMLIVGEINAEAYEQFTDKLYELELESPDKEVVLTLVSDGGHAEYALAFYSRMRSSSCPITVMVRGCVQSAATIILAAGRYRMMDKDAWFMIHDSPTPSSKDKSPAALASEAQFHERLELQWAEIMSRHSNRNSMQWRHMSQQTTYLSAPECLLLGLIEEVVE